MPVTPRTKPTSRAAAERRRASRAPSALLAAFLFLVAIGCAGPATTGPATTEIPTSAALANDDHSYGAPVRVDVEQSEHIPIEDDDPSWGSPGAPVTLVAFLDFQCPFCVRAHTTVHELREAYGPEKLRVVVKHNPLPFHPQAEPAALAAQAVHDLAGDEAFFAYARTLFANARSLDEESFLDWAEEHGVDREGVATRMGDPDTRAAVERDMALARAIGARGTPNFRINGIEISGAQPYLAFQQVIDDELEQAARLERAGTPPGSIYARRVEANFEPPPPRRKTSPRRQDDSHVVYAIPVGKSPVRGPPDALVTIVAFQDFQCPFCRRVQPTVDELFKLYAGKIRYVFKHNPLGFHQRALPAAKLAVEAYAQKGNAGFWNAARRLWTGQLEDSDLHAVAQDVGLSSWQVKQALTTDKHRTAIEDDQALASDFGARGTPHFFINGRRLAGAQPLAAFRERVDEALADAEALVARGIAKRDVYSELMKTAIGPKPPPSKQVPTPPPSAPSRGPKSAPVVIQMFADFECPFCKRVEPTLQALEKEFAGKIRIVWRHLPLPFHHHARDAAAAALEAKAQRGNHAFWKMHDAIYASQQSLDRATLELVAQRMGLDVARFARALDDGRHDAVIDADMAIADAAGIRGTPGFVINGYWVSGAQPAAAFRKVIRRALDDLKKQNP